MEGDRKVIWLEGNIAAGKSTIGKMLKESGKFDFIEEPVGMWREGLATNMLEALYHDKSRWAFTFQIMAFISRLKTWMEILAQTTHPRVILERSVFTDRYVFAELMHRQGAISDVEWQIYCGMWDFVVLNFCITPDCILYLDTPPVACLERIKARGREEEAGITLEYLQGLRVLHDEWLLGDPSPPVVILDGGVEWEAGRVYELVKEYLEWVRTWAGRKRWGSGW